MIHFSTYFSCVIVVITMCIERDLFVAGVRYDFHSVSFENPGRKVRKVAYARFGVVSFIHCFFILVLKPTD